MCKILCIVAIISCITIVGANRYVRPVRHTGLPLHHYTIADNGDEDSTPSDEEDGESEFA